MAKVEKLRPFNCSVGIAGNIGYSLRTLCASPKVAEILLMVTTLLPILKVWILSYFISGMIVVQNPNIFLSPLGKGPALTPWYWLPGYEKGLGLVFQSSLRV